MDKCWCGNQELHAYSEFYCQCKNCRSLVSKIDISYDADNIQDQEDFYGKSYWEEKMVSAAQKQNLSEVVDLYLTERAVYWLQTLLHYAPPMGGRLAEVGCGLGQFSYLAKLAGYRQTAFELSPEICNYIHKTLKLNVVCGGMKEEPNAYQVIAAFDVLEHLTDPRDFIKIAAKNLSEDGILLMQTPCYDDTLDYAAMLREKPRFRGLLVETEHTYLFSKGAVRTLLAEAGFPYVEFLDAYFGNDYDMFFVASRKPIHPKVEAEIEQSLYLQDSGRLIKALITLWSDKRDLSSENLLLHEQFTVHMQQIESLSQELKVSEADRAARLELIQNLSEQLKASEADRMERVNQIKALSEQLKASEADRMERVNQIKALSEQLTISEEDRAERLNVINLLSEQLKNSEEDRAARLDVIERLSQQLKISEADRAERLKQIELLTEQLKPAELDA